jgi:hypothetical protein
MTGFSESPVRSVPRMPVISFARQNQAAPPLMRSVERPSVRGNESDEAEREKLLAADSDS